MKLSVFAISAATLRDLVRFIRERPAIMLVATAVTAPLEYWLTLITLAAEGNESLGSFVASSALSVLMLAIWLPLCLVAIRQIVSGETGRLTVGGALPKTTRSYAVYNILLLLAMQLLISIGSLPSALLFAKVVLGLALTWLAVRTTLFATALAIGRSDLGLSQSIARTSGHTFRLLGIVVLTVIAVLAMPFVAGLVMVVFLDEIISDALLYSTVLLGVFNQFASLGLVMAGAHVYRAMELTPPQNGRY